MAKSTRGSELIELTFNHFDESVKRYLEEIPKQIQDAELEPPGGKAKKPPIQNPFRSI